MVPRAGSWDELDYVYEGKEALCKIRNSSLNAPMAFAFSVIRHPPRALLNHAIFILEVKEALSQLSLVGTKNLFGGLYLMN